MCKKEAKKTKEGKTTQKISNINAMKMIHIHVQETQKQNAN